MNKPSKKTYTLKKSNKTNKTSKTKSPAAKAMTAAARKLAVIFSTMVTEGKAYHEFGEDSYLTQQQQRNLKKLR